MLYSKNFKTILGYECLSACLSGYLFNRGINIDGSDIFFLGDGFVSEYEKEKMIYRVNTYNCNFSFLQKYEIQYHYGTKNLQNEACFFLENCIKSERDIIIKVSSNCLKYNRIYNQPNGSPHCISIIGCKENFFYISDGYIPMYNPVTFNGWISQKDIIEAWRKENFFYILLPESYGTLMELKRTNVNVLVSQKIKEGIDNYLFYNRLNCNSYFSGISALNAFLNDLISYADRTNNFKKLMFDINYNLKLYGFISYREMMLNELCKISMDYCIINKFRNIVEKWKKWCLLLVKLGVLNKKEMLNDFIKETQKIISQENKVLIKIWHLL